MSWLCLLSADEGVEAVLAGAAGRAAEVALAARTFEGAEEGGADFLGDLAAGLVRALVGTSLGAALRLAVDGFALAAADGDGRFIEPPVCKLNRG